MLDSSCPHMTEQTSQTSCQFLKFLLNPGFHSKHQDFTDQSPCFLSLPFRSILYTVNRVLSKTCLIGNILMKSIKVLLPAYRIKPNLALGVAFKPFSTWSNTTILIHPLPPSNNLYPIPSLNLLYTLAKHSKWTRWFC